MDKYEYSIKADKIRKLVDRKDYVTAVKIADTIDWERVKNSKMLSTVSLAYEKMERYEDAKDILLMAYESAPVGRRFLYRLTELAVKEGKLEEAETYLKEFAATSPKDPSRLILRYEIAEAGNEPLERLITILEAYQKREFEERWSCELASLYYRAGKMEECVKLCDEIILWFGVGPYVDKALELKQEIQPLTPEQLERKEHKEKYLRQLADVQKEFEEKENSLIRRREKKPADSEEAEQEAGEPEKKDRGEDTEEKPKKSSKILKLQKREEAAEDDGMSDYDTAREADSQNMDLQEEMEASLAKEIESAAMTATLNEMMLRETAATMEEVGAVNNDHSDSKERTKIAADRFVERTQEFAREAFVINEVLKEVTGEAVSPDLIEEKLRRLAVEEVWAEAAQTEEPVKEEPAVGESHEEAVQTEEPVKEEPAVDESHEEAVQTEEPMKEESAVDESHEEAVQAEEPVKEEPAVDESHEEAVQTEEPVKEEPTVDESHEKEVQTEEPVKEEPAVDESHEEAVQAETSRTNQIVRDHYVLAAAADEAEGLQKSVDYIRDTRLSMGTPATQIAKITGQKLATKEIAKTMRKLQGRDLVISGIADLPDEILLEIIQWMAEDQVESFIVLLDTKQELEQLIARKPYFAKCVYLSDEPQMKEEAEPEAVSETVSETTSEDHTLAELVEAALKSGGLEAYQTRGDHMSEAEKGPERKPYSDEAYAAETRMEPDRKQIRPGIEGTLESGMQPQQFVETAAQYARMLDTIIDEMGELALFALAEDYQQEREPLTEELAQEVVEKAILRAEKRSLKSLFSNRYDKDGYLILKEKHFKED